MRNGFIKGVVWTIIALSIARIIYIVATTPPPRIEESMERCRVNKIIRIDDYQEGRSVYPTQLRWILQTDEGYKVIDHSGNFRVGDSINIKVIRVSKQ